MNDSTARKRNRSDNFEVNDIELLIGLVSEHSDMLDSPKLDVKKQGWEQIATKFNDSCTGINRDVNALKLKVKNLKAQSKKSKLDLGDPLAENHSNNGNAAESEINNEDDMNNDEDYDPDNSDVDTKPNISRNSSKIRKRCKRFTGQECDLLLKLYEQYCVGLDSSSTTSSVKKRSEAWDNLTAAFNTQQTTGTIRECNELKIKIKNLKASRVKLEPSETDNVMVNSHMFNDSENSSSKPPVVIQEKKVITARPTRSLQSQPQKSYEELAHSTATNDIYYDEVDEFEEDFNRSGMVKNPVAATDKEIQRIHKENLLLKNAVLRKKERLLELQISLAERNLRRQL